MADIMDIIKERRSIRQYDTTRPIPDDVLNQVLEAVRWSPSWANSQCWEVIVVKDPQVKQKLQGCFTRNPALQAVVDAPVVIGLCGRLGAAGFYKGQSTTKFGDWYMFDLGIAAQTLCLAAHALGLGTVITGLFNIDMANAALGVPEGYQLVSLIPMGYPAKGSPAPRRREIGEFTHMDKF
jgi:nitroreductase